MTHNERLLAVFRGERLDVMPWYADLTYWYSAEMIKGTLPEKYRGDGVVQLYQDLNTGAHEHLLNCPWRAEYEDVQVKVEEERDADGRPVRIRTTWVTPVGTISQVQEFEPNSYCWAYREYPVKTPNDLKVLRFIFQHTYLTPDYTEQHRIIDLFGDWGVAASMPNRTPMANLFVIWMGVTNAVYALTDAPEEIEETIEVMSAAEDRMYEIICNAPAPLVYFPDNITGEVVSPRIFQKYYAPYYRKRAEQLHRAGKYIFVHIDGTFKNLLPYVGPTGVDCAQSLTPAPVGDVPLEDFRRLARPDLILWGGVPAAYFSPLYSEETLRDIVLKAIRLYKNDPRFMLCVCDQVPPDGIIERVRMVSDLVEEYGRIE